ncbi:MAG: hypothetical protein IID08_03480 [Candidatus Hydrogenedentes bacterium]|nr:hypothetical protein [Candidatus Hydrogenedentota bacterium]
MKKFVIIAAVMLIGAGAALAASINVPFFLDTTAAGGGFPPTSGTMFFIGLKNTTGASVTVTVEYRDDTGTVTTGAGSVTLTLAGFESVSFRPSIADPGVDTPNAAGLARSTAQAGGATFTWTGGTNDIQGRGVQISGTGAGSFSFLLPPGI